jgi:succinate dehydrogenase / fumarate reductase iron-sulfur subunit
MTATQTESHPVPHNHPRIDPSHAPKTIRFKIKRQDSPEGQPYWNEFDVPYKPNLNVISCLNWIAAHPTTTEGKNVTPIAWDCSCLEEVCGACTMNINGKVRQSCTALVDNIINHDGSITLEPMTKFPVVRDLMVNRQRMFDDLKRIKGWVPIDGTYALGPGPRESPAQQDMRYSLSKCMTCGCCLEACPQYGPDLDWIGPQIAGQTLYFNLHETGKRLKDDRLNVMESAGGIGDCGNAQNCVKVCPKEVPLLDALGAMGRQTTIHAIKKFFTGR